MKDLIQLQSIDRSIIEKKSYLKMPHNLPVLNEEDPIVDLYKYGKKHLDKIKASYSAAQSELDQINKALSSAGGFKSKIRTNVEYQTYKEKLELLSHKRSVLADRVKDLAQKMTEEMIGLSKLEERITENNKSSDSATAKYIARIESLKSDVADLYRKRRIIVQVMDNAIYELYMSLINCCEGLVVVEAMDRVCKGCHLIMPRDVYLNVLSLARIEHCPNCMRILYHHNHLM
ncbi:MAG: hypothetical protein FJ240_13315 [Nitrospira sp.]|nr:hypothetical protein [Nitrospira sp.]